MQHILELLDPNLAPQRLEGVFVPISAVMEGLGWTFQVLIRGPDPPHPFATEAAPVSYVLSLSISPLYPKKAPIVSFDQIVYHPNVEQRTLAFDHAFYHALQWNQSSTLATLINLIISTIDEPILVCCKRSRLVWLD